MNKLLLILLLFSCPLALQAQSGNALSFDNVDDRVNVPNASANVVNSTTISISMWVYPQNTAPSFPDFDGFAGFRNNNDCDFYILQLSATNIEARFRNSLGTAYDIVYTGLQLNAWQHFVLTLDGTDLSLFHDGSLVNTVQVSGTITNPSESFYLGVLPWTGSDFYLNGRLDEVCLWNKALTTSEVACIQMGGADLNNADLILNYKCNQGVANGNNAGITSLTDSKGNINGTILGFGMFGSSSNFINGVTTPLAISLSDTLCPGSSYIFGSQSITAPGNYFEVFPLAGGCDSIVELTLTSPTINTAVSQAGPTLLSQQAGALYQWIDCVNGNTPVAGATSQSFTATANGQYAVVVTLGGCSDTSVCINVTNVGLAEADDVLINVGPNPFTDEIQFSLKSNSGINSLLIYNYTGALVKEIPVRNNNTVRVPTSSWSSGVYLIRSDRHRFIQKCIKY